MRGKVERLGLDVDVYVEYGKGILEDDDMEIEERVESVIGIFSGAADGLASDDVIAKELDATRMVADIERIVQETKQLQAQAEDLKRAEIELRDLKLREQEKKAAEEAKEKEKEKANARQKMYVAVKVHVLQTRDVLIR